jgi:hypothetical protein
MMRKESLIYKLMMNLLQQQNVLHHVTRIDTWQATETEFLYSP